MVNEGEEIKFGEPSPELKKYMAELDEERKNARFGKLSHWIVDSGVLAILKPSAVKVFHVFIRYADFVTLVGRVGNKKISEKSGVKGVSACINDLTALGIIKAWRRGWQRYYQIQSSPAPDIDRKVKNYRRLLKIGKYPKKSDTYLRDLGTGRFVRNEQASKYPKTSVVPHPKKSVPA